MAEELGITDAESYARIFRQSGIVGSDTPAAEDPSLFVRAVYLTLEQQSDRQNNYSQLIEKKSLGWITPTVRVGRQFIQLFLKQIRAHICDGRKLKGIATLTPHAVCTAIAVEIAPLVPWMPQAMLIPFIAALLYMIFNSLKTSFCQMTDEEFMAELEKSQVR